MSIQMTTDASKAYRLLKERIISLDLAPGSVIQDAALVEQLGLGRTPIREALKLLEAEKLIVTVPRRGIFVSHVSITDLQQLSEVRMEVEGLSARLAAERASAEEIEELQRCCDEFPSSPDLPAKARIDADRQLHLLLAEATHNRFLRAEVERFYDLSLRLWHLALERVQAAEVSVTTHQKILGAIRRRDADAAEELMREHIREFHTTVKSAM